MTYDPSPYGSQPPYPNSAKTNTLAIVAFVLAFVCSIAGLVCGIISRNQIKQTGEGGGGLALAAIIISSISIVIAIIYVIVVVAAVGSVSTSP